MEVTSERRLAVALSASGRDVTLSQLGDWRKDGLLPPLASYGTGSGRSYYWREPDILDQACAAHDLLRRHGRSDIALIGLWLRGFRVPLGPLRRAWLHRAKSRGKPKARETAARIAPGAPAQGLTGILLRSLACAGAAIDQDDAVPLSVLPMLERALAQMGHGEESPVPARQLWRQVNLTVLTLENSDLMQKASDESLLEAQRYLRLAAGFLRRCPDDEAAIEAFAPGLFLYVLALLHSGQTAVLEAAAKQIAGMDRRDRAAPVHIRASV